MTTRRTEEESRAGSDDDFHQVEDVKRQIGGMELVLARFERTNPPTFSAAEGVDIEQRLMEVEAPIQQTTVRTYQPVQDASQSFYSPQGSQQQQQSNRQRFRPRGKNFKKKVDSSSSGSVSYGSGSGSGSGSSGMSCRQCGGRHPTSQCRGVQGSCRNRGQPGHFLRVCPLLRGQSSISS
ncbi:hypothetical protein F511_30184 [Dorcoceras hygrometricum]|uniref:CCHC-type domain-containing protein n=1 Tax=Dorcoceras hygrometricum TaxID=472368 RepID=A0A2Z7CM61_9LAMI|nr:hypothetical protein F511_30184 [Dorcoceras hygrometricum]